VTPIDEYLARVKPAKRRVLERTRALAKKAVPEADETISYGMPTFTFPREAVSWRSTLT